MKQPRSLALLAATAAIALSLVACASPPPAPAISVVETPAAPAPTSAAAVAPAAATIPANAVQLEGRLGELYQGAFDATVADCFLTFAVEPGATYELLIVDGYNNGQNAGMRLEAPAKAVGWWLCEADSVTSYPKAAYLEWDNDSKSSYGFIGLTPDAKAGPVARFAAAGGKLVVHVQRYKASYVGQFLVKLERK